MGDGGQGRLRHDEYFSQVEVPFVEWCALNTGIWRTFSTPRLVSPVSKTTAQRLDQWKAVLGQYDYTIMHIAGGSDCGGDLLSWWVIVPSVSVRASAVYAASEPDETLPSKQAIRDGQHALRANLGTLAAGVTRTSFITDDGQITLDDEGLFWL